MRILISGICGFAGSAIARTLAAGSPGTQILGFDNFIRPGSETNRAGLKRAGAQIFHADVRSASDIEALPAADWVIDAAANPSVLAGIDGQSSSRQVVEHNLQGTVNLLEYCKRHKAGFTLLSTSRVYSIAALAGLPVKAASGAFRLQAADFPRGVGPAGVSEEFATTAPVSLYGATKLASEALALEYGEAFGLPVFVNRCGILAGAGQFGRADQGIFSYWINSHLRRRPLKYIGFGGTGHQVRDCLHPGDLVTLLLAQAGAPNISASDRVINVGGGAASAMSLRELTLWCDKKFGTHPVSPSSEARPFDIPWIVLDATKAHRLWGWAPKTPVLAILEEIAAHAVANPGWLEVSAPL